MRTFLSSIFIFLLSSQLFAGTERFLDQFLESPTFARYWEVAENKNKTNIYTFAEETDALYLLFDALAEGEFNQTIFADVLKPELTRLQKLAKTISQKTEYRRLFSLMLHCRDFAYIETGNPYSNEEKAKTITKKILQELKLFNTHEEIISRWAAEHYLPVQLLFGEISPYTLRKLLDEYTISSEPQFLQEFAFMGILEVIASKSLFQAPIPNRDLKMLLDLSDPKKRTQLFRDLKESRLDRLYMLPWYDASSRSPKLRAKREKERQERIDELNPAPSLEEPSRMKKLMEQVDLIGASFYFPFMYEGMVFRFLNICTQAVSEATFPVHCVLISPSKEGSWLNKLMMLKITDRGMIEKSVVKDQKNETLIWTSSIL